MFQLSERALIFLENNRQKSTRIVFTNGCFDILHSGHVSYLNEARALGDLLFVGLNSDSSIKRIKGPDRPINKEHDRKFVLENLKAVDFVEIFDQDTPYELIRDVRPDILVKGGDWSIDKIVGSDFVLSYGGKVLPLKYIDGQSTTSIIQQIKDHQNR